VTDVRVVPEPDWPQLGPLSAEAFGGPPGDAWLASLKDSVSVGAYDGERVVAHARVKPYRQWFGGRAVPMGGVASVAVAATHQRRGLGRVTVGALLPVMREEGQWVSSLYPATAPLYRGLGWELAGDYTWVDVPGESLRALGPCDGLRPATPADVPAMKAAYARVCAETSGMLDRTGPFFDANDPLAAGWSVVHDGPDGVDGYALADRRYRDHHSDVTAWDVVGTTPEATRAVWFALGAGSSVTPSVRAKAFPDDVLPLLAEPSLPLHEHQRWMLRIVSLPEAVAARGWPSIEASVDLHVRDEQVAGNDGAWRLAVSAGEASAERGGSGAVALGIGALSALYTGYADPFTLRRSGLLTGDDASLGALAVMTCGPRPRMLDYF
jgi:predicted acetyltransferase